MDLARRHALIERLERIRSAHPDEPLPLLSLEEFFVGNDDYGSIGCNLSPLLGPQFFYETLMHIRSQPNVQDVLVQLLDFEKEDASMWPFSDTVYIFAD